MYINVSAMYSFLRRYTYICSRDGYIFHHHSSRTNNTLPTYRYIVYYSRPCTNERIHTNSYGPRKMCADGNMDKIVDYTIVVNGTTGVNNDTITDSCSRIHNSSCHDNRAATNDRAG